MHSGAGLTAAEIRTLFTHLETWGGARRAGGGGGDGNGVVPWKTLLDAVRPPLCGQRLELVRLAFTEMDRRGEGVVSPETVSQRCGNGGLYIVGLVVLFVAVFGPVKGFKDVHRFQACLDLRPARARANSVPPTQLVCCALWLLYVQETAYVFFHCFRPSPLHPPPPALRQSCP